MALSRRFSVDILEVHVNEISFTHELFIPIYNVYYTAVHLYM